MAGDPKRRCILHYLEKYPCKGEVRAANEAECENILERSGRNSVPTYRPARQAAAYGFCVGHFNMFCDKNWTDSKQKVAIPNCVRDRVPRSRFFQVARDVFLAQITYCILDGVPDAYTSWASSRKSLNGSQTIPGTSTGSVTKSWASRIQGLSSHYCALLFRVVVLTRLVLCVGGSTTAGFWACWGCSSPLSTNRSRCDVPPPLSRTHTTHTHAHSPLSIAHTTHTRCELS